VVFDCSSFTSHGFTEAEVWCNIDLCFLGVVLCLFWQGTCIFLFEEGKACTFFCYRSKRFGILHMPLDAVFGVVMRLVHFSCA
jgi:hypothetical protein